MSTALKDIDACYYFESIALKKGHHLDTANPYLQTKLKPSLKISSVEVSPSFLGRQDGKAVAAV